MSIREIIQIFPEPDKLVCINPSWLKQYSEALAKLIDEDPTAMLTYADVNAAFMDVFQRQPSIEELKLIEGYAGENSFKVCAEWLRDVVLEMRGEGILKE